MNEELVHDEFVDGDVDEVNSCKKLMGQVIE